MRVWTGTPHRVVFMHMALFSSFFLCMATLRYNSRKTSLKMFRMTDEVLRIWSCIRGCSTRFAELKRDQSIAMSLE
ncbi:hypothetical protein GGU10DRAFT_366692 [Lentinula aff. detonsa]|uniref:Uncharacterized protein n=1 Tax=Lentinula aff. detonsa TaxID=2804958 RepID=A0AA38KCB0_9AGAR|nr:hypothetical protein GGU10DRAFT_366692 [Lentinula aff. detonsa]